MKELNKLLAQQSHLSHGNGSQQLKFDFEFSSNNLDCDCEGCRAKGAKDTTDVEYGKRRSADLIDSLAHDFMPQLKRSRLFETGNPTATLSALKLTS